MEAQAAASYWKCFEGIPLNWNKIKNVPVNWLNIGQRTSPKTNSPRKAIDPFNAGLNYLYAVLETKIKTTCLSNGLDPDFGILHVDKASRTSLVFDLMEPLRPKIDRILFDWFMITGLNKKDFFETREGVCQLSPAIVFQIVPLLLTIDDEISKLVKEFSGFFRNKMVQQKPIEFHVEPPTFKPKKPRKSKLTVKQLETRFEEREQQPSKKTIEPGECPECGITFTPTANGQKFCCKAHSNRFRQKKLREQRIAKGLCPMCGSDMPKATPWGKWESLYCEKCTEIRRKQKSETRNKQR